MLIHQYIYHIAILQLILIVSILYLYRTIYSYANKKAEKDNETKLQVTINELEIYKKNLITKRSHKIKEAVEKKYIHSQKLVKGIPYEEVERQYLTNDDIESLYKTDWPFISERRPSFSI